ncbi:LapA family protein [Umezawaea beigongshangensis]|uniref:LapA family protein n=1 Tax=Umezawaea beigongshangensis TaxID=2780383 RepID=UPI0027DD1B89|nr:LapA family protein [Umezawaea beigongshangensis]
MATSRDDSVVPQDPSSRHATGRELDPLTPPPLDGTPPVVAPDPEPPLAPEHAPEQPFHRTRTSGAWVAVVVAAILLIFLLVFVLQNLDGATVQFLGIEATMPLGVALLFAAVIGALLVALVGGARIVQLRRQAKRALH